MSCKTLLVQSGMPLRQSQAGDFLREMFARCCSLRLVWLTNTDPALFLLPSSRITVLAEILERIAFIYALNETGPVLWDVAQSATAQNRCNRTVVPYEHRCRSSFD